MIPTILAVLVVAVALPLNWYVTLKLWRLARSAPEIAMLRERALVALALALIVTVFAAIFLNNEMVVPLFDLEATRIITRSAMLALSGPALYWLWLYRNGRR